MSRADQIIDKREDYRKRLEGSRSRAHALVVCLIENPFITTAMASSRLTVSYQGAINLLRQLEKEGIIEPVHGVPGRSRRWVARDIYEILTGSNTATLAGR